MFKTFPLLALLILALACESDSTDAESQEPLLSVGGKTLTLTQIKKILPPQKLTVFEAHLKKPVEFISVPLIPLLNSQFGTGWQKTDGVLFTALDGYRSDVSVQKILKYQPHLAFSFSEANKEFKIDNQAQNEKDVELGPFFLIWDNIRNPQLKREGSYGWPYQVASVEPILYSSYYAKAFPIKNPSADHKRGFEHFKNYCMTCHSVSGNEGGAKGPVLYPNPTVVKKGYKYFSKWVQSPSKVLPATTMPALNPELTQKERDEVTNLIYKYLIALNKK